MTLKHKLLTLLLIPTLIGSSIALMVLSYLFVPLIIVGTVGIFSYSVVKIVRFINEEVYYPE